MAADKERLLTIKDALGRELNQRGNKMNLFDVLEVVMTSGFVMAVMKLWAWVSPCLKVISFLKRVKSFFWAKKSKPKMTVYTTKEKVVEITEHCSKSGRTTVTKTSERVVRQQESG